MFLKLYGFVSGVIGSVLFFYGLWTMPMFGVPGADNNDYGLHLVLGFAGMFMAGIIFLYKEEE